MQKVALLIGISDYQYVSRLDTPINDIHGIRSILTLDFGFEVYCIEDPDKIALSNFSTFLRSLSENSISPKSKS